MTKRIFRKSLYNFRIIYLLFVSGLNCFPILRMDSESSPEEREEKRYPNGTVVGKYTYLDNDGTPVHVKYFANDSSYGVELKSAKQIVYSKTPPNMENNDGLQSEYSMSNSKIPAFNADTFNTYNSKNSYYNKHNIDSKESVQNLIESQKSRPFKANFKGNLDYDIYQKNEIRSPKKCDNKGKLHVYVDKSSKKSPIIDNGISAFCSKV